jgi:hypothetical protein
MNFPKNFDRWPPFVQKVWLRANPGVHTRDHRSTPNHRAGGDYYEQLSSHRGVSSRDPGRAIGLGSSRYDRMLASGDIEGLLNDPGASEWLKDPANNLKVMLAIQNENRVFTALSNVIKTKHDTSKAAINNIRA